MKKRLIPVLLLLCICLMLLPVKAEAATSGSCGNGVYFSFSESTGLLKIYGSGDMWDFQYNYGYSSAPWWEYVAKIKKVEIGSGVTRIGNTAFNGCWNAESITIPETVTSIGSKAFYGCTALTSITIPSKVTAIESYTFYRTGITEIDLPDGITSLGTAAFAESSLTSIDIPAGVTTISVDLLANCDHLEKVTIRGDITNIGESAFYSAALKELVFEGTLSGEIGDHAFAYCENLAYFHVPGTVTDIEDYAFCGCESLTELTLEEGITDIGDSAFRETGISTLMIPSTVTYFGNNIAVYADNLKSVTLYSQSLAKCKSAVFSNGDLDYVHIIGDAPTTTVEVFARPDLNPGFIVYYDEGTSGWEEPTWNGYLIEVWGKPWSTKTGTCGENVTWALTADGVLTISGTGPMKDVSFYDAPWYLYRHRIQKVVVEEGVTTVGQWAFYDLYNLKSAEIAGSVETIKQGAFQKCKLMDTIVLGEGLKQIDGYVFRDCNALTVIDLPDSLTTLKSGAFSDCYGLKTVYMPAGLTDLPNAPFSSWVKEIYFPGNAPTFGSNCFNNLTATAYYPAGNATWTEEVLQNYGGTITWVPYGEVSEPTAKFTTISTSLGGNIAMNFYLELSEDLVSDPEAYIQFTYAGKTLNVPLSEGVLSGGVYRFACPITSKNMTDEITAQVYNGSGAVGESKTMDVATYCNWVIANYTDAKTVNLMKAMLNYGASAQMLFNYRTDDLANAALAESDKVFEAVDASAFLHSRTGEEEGIKPDNYTLLLDSETTVRVYFKLTGDKTIDEYTFTVDGVEVTPKFKDGLYYIEKANISAHRLDDLSVFTCGGITITYGGLSYVNQVMTYYTEGTTFDMASALYAYSVAAEAYIG